MFEYCEHDLSALLDQVRSPFSESEVKSLVFQLTSAVAHLHDNWVIHRGTGKEVAVNKGKCATM